MTNTSGLSEAKRALLKKYLRGDISQAKMATDSGTQHANAEVSSLRERVVEIQAGGSKRPFFFLHGHWEGTPFFCFPLARELGQDQPFYALEPYRFDGLPIPPTFKDMVKAHVKLLREIQPEGPYLLGGFCNGGLIAREMAQQLHSEDQQIDLLVLIDPPLIGSLRAICQTINHFGKLMRLSEDKRLYCFLWLRHMYRYLEHIYKYLHLPIYRKLTLWMNAEQVRTDAGAILELKARYGFWLDYGRQRVGISKQIEPACKPRTGSFALLKRILDALFLDPIFPPADVLRHDWPGMYCWAYSDYVPDFYPGKSTLFFLGDSEDYYRSAKRGKAFRKKNKEIEVHVISGTQTTIKTEHLHDLAVCLSMCLSMCLSKA